MPHSAHGSFPGWCQLLPYSSACDALRRQRGRPARHGPAAPARPRARPADPAQQRLAAVRRASRGWDARRRSTTRSPPRCAAAASRCSTSPNCSPRRWRVAEARAELTAGVLADPRLGDTLRRRVADHLADLDPAALAGVLIGGLAHEELRTSWERPGGLVYTLMDRHDFVIDPLPNLLFTRDSSVWIRRPGGGDQPGHAGPAPGDHADQRDLPAPPAVRRHGVRLRRRPWSTVEGGDVLLLAPGVLAVGVGERTTPAGAERLARQVFAEPAGAHDPGGADRPGAGDDAPRHDRARWSTSTRWSCTRTSPTR